MTSGRLSRISSAIGLVGTLLTAAAVASTAFLFVRLALHGGLSSTAFATVGVFGNEINIRTLSMLGFYAALFLVYPTFLLITLLWSLFSSNSTKLDAKVRSKTPSYAIVAAIIGASDAITLFKTGLHGEAGALATASDAAMFAIFLVHRFAMVAFFIIMCKKGFERTPFSAWLLPIAWSLSVAGVAVCRCAGSSLTQENAPAFLYALAGTVLAVSFMLAAASSTKGDTLHAPSN